MHPSLKRDLKHFRIVAFSYTSNYMATKCAANAAFVNPGPARSGFTAPVALMAMSAIRMRVPNAFQPSWQNTRSACFR